MTNNIRPTSQANNNRTFNSADTIPLEIYPVALVNGRGPQTPVMSGSSAEDPRPEFMGAAKAGEVVTLYDQNGTVLGSTVATANNLWQFQIETALEPGMNTIIARTATQSSSEFSLDVHRDPGTPVTFDSLAYDNVGSTKYFQSGSTTDDDKPTFSGKSAPDELVTLYDETGRALGSTMADKNGSWSLEITESLNDGNHSITAKTATQSSINFVLTVESAENTPVTMDFLAYDNVGQPRYFPSGDITDDNRPTFSGKAGENEIVTLFDETGCALGSVKAGQYGKWSLEITEALSDGYHTITARTATQSSGSFSLNVQTSAPPVPVTLDGWAYDNVNESKYFRSGETTDDNRPTFSGSAGRNELVTLYDETGRAVGSVKADFNGKWSLEITEALSDGYHTITAQTATQSSNSFSLNVLTNVQVPVTIDPLAYDNVGKEQYFFNGGSTDDTRPTFSGTAGANELVTLRDETGRELGSVHAGPDGRWSLEITEALSEGRHTVTAHTDTQSSRYGFNLNIQSATHVPVSIDPVAYDNVGEEQYFPIGGVTDDNRPTFSGNANANELVVLRDETGRPLGSVIAGSDGRWSLEITTPLSNGTHAVIATAGMGKSASFVLNVQAAIHDPVTISPVAYDNVGEEQYFFNTGTTDDNRPTFSGTAGANELVTLQDHTGLQLGSVIAGSDGRWSLEITESLNVGYNVVNAHTANSSSVGFTLYVQAPVEVQALDIKSMLQDGQVEFFVQPEDELEQAVLSLQDLAVSAPVETAGGVTVNVGNTNTFIEEEQAREAF